MFCIEVREEPEDPNAIVVGTLLVNHLYVHESPKKLACKLEEMDVQLCVMTPLGSIFHMGIIFKNYAINANKRILPVDLIQLKIQGYKVILGMNRLTRYNVASECKKKLISFSTIE